MKRHFVYASLVLSAFCGSLSATPSGLNNIPTADVTPMGVGVIQAFSNFGNDIDSDFNLGFKTGLDILGQKFEIGADSHILPDKGGPVVLQAKYSLPLGEGLPTLGIGVANIALGNDDRDRAGDPFTYVVLSHDFDECSAPTPATASRRTTTPCSSAWTRPSRCWSAASCCART